jgi:transcriptional regulator with XRE-family HTH domain
MSGRLNSSLVREFLDKNLKTREWLAVQLDVSGSQISRILSGYVPKNSTIEHLAILMNVAPDVLILHNDIKVD